MTVYISIPMSGLDMSIQSDIAKKWQLYFERQGHKVINPFNLSKELEKHHKLHSLINPTYDEYLRYDLLFIKKCTHIFMCNGWNYSNGCRIEMLEAIKFGLGILTEKYYQKFIL